jgi:hypothetical protein
MSHATDDITAVVTGTHFQTVLILTGKVVVTRWA